MFIRQLFKTPTTPFRTKRYSHIFGIVLFCLLFPLPLSAQDETTVVGQVFDLADRSPIPNINVYFKQTAIGTVTDDNGFFFLRTTGRETTLVFSSIGYKKQEVKLKQGKIAQVEIFLKEENTWLEDVLILPGTNPALDWMKKIRLMRKQNDLTAVHGYRANSTEQDLILLSKSTQGTPNKQLFDQFRQGTLSENDSLLLVPLYMAEKSYQIAGKQKTEITRNTFSSSDESLQFVTSLLDGVNAELNFYENAVKIFDKNIISPLSSVGNSYYNYYLVDSVGTGADIGKQYRINFRTKNPKNLAFDGHFLFDSLSLALTSIEVELPPKANINYINNLRIKQRFGRLNDHYRMKETEEISLTMHYDMPIDSLRRRSELLIKRSTFIDRHDTTNLSENFAQSAYSVQTLEAKMKAFDNTPIMRTAKWLADAALTSYARVGVIDVGRLQNIARLTDLEGLRINLPVRTNERLWKSLSIGGYIGYGLRNREIKYSFGGQYRFPFAKRFIAGASYTDDYRRIDYNYNRFPMREDPWLMGDEDITNTIFSFHSAGKINRRKEWLFSIQKDWNNNIESGLYYRINTLYPNEHLPFKLHGTDISSVRQQSFTFSTRFSFGQERYDDHLNRIFAKSYKPVCYLTAEGASVSLEQQRVYYGKLSGVVMQRVRLDIGQWNYMVEAGLILGKAPYPLLDISSGKEPSGIGIFHFNKMRYLEFASDNYLHLYNEFLFNGMLFNHLPYIKTLNLREMLIFNIAYGSLSDRHRSLMDYPAFMHDLRTPYIEVGIGITNILRLFSAQVTYRLTNLRDNLTPYSIAFGIRLGF
ncbi:MAG: DUF5686 and carboxypeptidase regulatory-like domain-containing protein [Prevotellaceae bacterium]|jgi:hypothetical protein|nr:DUF5686 and carboxypeptidase regulatory-like domain-containing protein [Prevotellaceae bacterium]